MVSDVAGAGTADCVRDDRPQGVGVRDWVVFPVLVLRARDLARVVAADQVDLAVTGVVPRSHEAADVRHRRACRPGP